MRTIEWDYKENKVGMIDQRLLPDEFKIVSYDDYHQVAYAIRDMVIRGAPAIGAAAAFGLALAAQQSPASDLAILKDDMQKAVLVLIEARPTAVNLNWALTRVMNQVEESEANVDEIRQLVLDEAQALADEDVQINQQMARHGAELIDDGDTIIHHCNTGALAAVDWGTALGVLRMAHELGKNIHVLLDETRPRLQGARLSAWELQQYGIPYDIISDNAAGYFLQSGRVQKVVFGADRVVKNGDVANKIGTYMLALAAHDNGIPAYAIVPTSTVDLSLAHGGLIPIEERNPDEVLDVKVRGRNIAPQGSTARNPAFDITPNRLVTAIVTENGVVYPPFTENLVRAVSGEVI
jgi:methylthioribose-1-phosphate isomerase